METPANRSNTVRFAARKATSPAFYTLYDEGMALVEETAAYLDGDGRKQVKSLDRIGTSLYAAESMRLTTRLMQIASWLLLQKALNAQEMTAEQVREERAKIRLDTASSGAKAEGWSQLPQPFLDLVARSLRLQNRVQQMDNDLFNDEKPIAVPDQDNPVEAQINLLRTAFGG